MVMTAEKINYKKFNKKNIIPQNDAPEVFDSLMFADARTKLFKYSQLYDNMSSFRKKRQRIQNYIFSRQWEDKVFDWKKGVWVREKDFIAGQNRIPFEHNVMQPQQNTVIGLFRANKTLPIAVARARDEQKISEMMSIALEYEYDSNNITEIDARTFFESYYSGLSLNFVGYKKKRSTKKYGIDVKKINQNMFFINSDYADDAYSNDDNLKCVGILHDWDLEVVIKEFWDGNPERAEKIREIYGHCGNIKYLENYHKSFTNDKFKSSDFFIPNDIGKCRVIEAWEYESKIMLECTDWLTSSVDDKITLREQTERKKIEEINAGRIRDGLEQGISEEDIPLIEINPVIDEYVYVRYLAPTGEILREGKSPFDDGLLPFAIEADIDDDGEIHSPAEFLINKQRQINRHLSQVDFILNTSVKETLSVSKESLDGNTMDLDDIVEQRTKANGVIVTKSLTDKGLPIRQPELLSGQNNSSAQVSLQLAQFYINEIQKISGVSEALQGQAPGAQTPAYRYAQETQNSTNNLRDMFDRQVNFRRKRDLLIMNRIIQFYDSPRYINITGKQYSEESKTYDPEKVRGVQMDLRIQESATSSTFRAMLDDMLMQLVAMPQAFNEGLTLLTVLRNISHPQADIIASQMEANMKKMQEEAAQQQGAMQMQQQAQNIPPHLQ